MEKATGKYFLFCDGDDYVGEQWVEHFLTVADKENARCFLFGGCQIDDLENGQTLVTFPARDFTPLEYITRSLPGYAWNVLFEREIIEKYSLKFPADVVVEDAPFCLSYLRRVEKITCTGYADYYYYRGEETTLSKKYYPYSYRRWEEKYIALRSFIEDIIPPQDQPEARKAAANSFLWYFLHSLDNTFDARNSDGFLKKMRYNRSVVRSAQFQDCLAHADLSREDPRLMRCLRAGHYLPAWALLKLSDLKNRLLRGNKENDL